MPRLLQISPDGGGRYIAVDRESRTVSISSATHCSAPTHESPGRAIANLRDKETPW